MDQIIRIGMDTSKRFFQLHGVDGEGRPVLRRQLTRAQVLPFFEKLETTFVAMEACGAAHHWARVLTRLGHEARLIAPQLAKPYVARGKNDAADAAALCEAEKRPHMRFVPAKSMDEQAALMLAGQRERLVRQRTQLVNTIRGHGAEFGLIAAKGPAGIGPLLERLARADIPALARELFAELREEHAALCGRIAALDRRLRGWRNANETARRLEAITGDWSVDRLASGDEGAGPASLQVGARLRRLARADAARPFDGRQGAAGADHPRRRSDAAQPARGRGDRGDLADAPGRGEKPVRLA